MKFEIIGNLNNPLIMMLTGSFYPSSGFYLNITVTMKTVHLQQDRMKLKNS